MTWAQGIVFYGRTGKFTFRMLMTVLVGQTIVVFFGALVAWRLALSTQQPAAGSRFVLGLVICLLCVVGAGLVRRSPVGVSVGWVALVATLLYAVLLPPMLVVGLIFLALWVGCLVAGHRVDLEDARRAAEREG